MLGFSQIDFPNVVICRNNEACKCKRNNNSEAIITLRLILFMKFCMLLESSKYFRIHYKRIEVGAAFL